MSEAGRLAGRAILVTGAGDGLGRAVAKSFAAHGAEVILLGRTPSKLEGVYDEIVAAGGVQPAIYPLDLAGATPKEYRDLANTLREEIGHLEGLLHNAAILEILTPLESHPFDVWERTLRANLTGPFLLTQACLPLLGEAADASIVFTGDECMTKPKGYWGAYGVSKAGMHNMALMLAQELSQTPVRVNVIDPGPVRTAMRLRTHPGAPLSSWPLPEELTAPYVALMCADSGQRGQVIRAQPGM
ncbi:MAG: SDR family NAD(P)-dependent oxidoreductase [Gammaproteobacteria bacterium]|nr:SDR family NAD(P)-dependent oxidoreductase [Gammaproteobacteria bacterium]